MKENEEIYPERIEIFEPCNGIVVTQKYVTMDLKCSIAKDITALAEIQQVPHLLIGLI